MSEYMVQHSYRTPERSYAAGEIVELSDEVAAFMLRDSPGVIAPTPQKRDLTEPENHRQVISPKQRRGPR